MKYGLDDDGCRRSYLGQQNRIDNVGFGVFKMQIIELVMMIDTPFAGGITVVLHTVFMLNNRQLDGEPTSEDYPEQQ